MKTLIQILSAPATKEDLATVAESMTAMPAPAIDAAGALAELRALLKEAKAKRDDKKAA
jgi:hypothetical protein